ncbi:MAG: hypothetical protein AAB267_09695 [Candidatus Desantisbacteria bacterium]
MKEILRKKFEEFRRIPFPNRSENDELCDILFDLVELDGHIAGLVSSYLSGGIIKKELVFIDEGLNARLENFVLSSEDEAKTVEEYKKYKAYLDELVQILKRAL